MGSVGGVRPAPQGLLDEWTISPFFVGMNWDKRLPVRKTTKQQCPLSRPGRRSQRALQKYWGQDDSGVAPGEGAALKPGCWRGDMFFADVQTIPFSHFKFVNMAEKPVNDDDYPDEEQHCPEGLSATE